MMYLHSHHPLICHHAIMYCMRWFTGSVYSYLLNDSIYGFDNALCTCICYIHICIQKATNHISHIISSDIISFRLHFRAGQFTIWMFSGLWFLAALRWHLHHWILRMAASWRLTMRQAFLRKACLTCSASWHVGWLWTRTPPFWTTAWKPPSRTSLPPHLLPVLGWSSKTTSWWGLGFWMDIQYYIHLHTWMLSNILIWYIELKNMDTFAEHMVRQWPWKFQLRVASLNWTANHACYMHAIACP